MTEEAWSRACLLGLPWDFEEEFGAAAEVEAELDGLAEGDRGRGRR